MSQVGGRVGFTPPGIWEFSLPYYNQGADYAHHITACPPRFENPAASLLGTWLFFQSLKKPSKQKTPLMCILYLI